tara:strand:- start:6264 stop:7331 length:1068 start_codon:yes stop_codon:yes gene_type:complete
LLKKFSFIELSNGYHNFSFGIIFSVIFHGTIFLATIFALPFVVKKPLELLPIVSVELIQISEETNIPYAPKAAKIIEKAKNDNKKLLSEQAPPKEVKKEQNKEVKLDNQKDEIDLTKSKKIPVPQKKQENVKLEKSDAVPLPEKKLEKVETKNETEQQPSKDIKKIIVKKEKRKKIEKKIDNDEVIKEFAKIKKPLKDEKVKQVSEYEKKAIDVNKIKGLIAKQYENIGEVKKKTDGVTQSEDKSMKLSKLSVTTEYAVRHQIYTCWSVPTGLPYSEDLLVTVKLNLEKNGIVKNFEMLDHVRMNTPGERAFYQIAQSVIRAIRLCNPIKNLPSTSYEKWKTMILRFNPVEMMGG